MRTPLAVLPLLHLLSMPVRAGEPAFDGRSVDVWLGLLMDDDREVYTKARADLVAGGDAALPVVREIVRRKPPEENSWYLGILAAIRPEETLPVWVRLLGSGDRWKAESAAEALGEIGEAAAPAADALVGVVSWDGYALSCEARDALRRIGPAAVPALVRGLESPRRLARTHCAEALGEIGPDARAVVPALVPRLSDEDEDARREAARALARLAPETPGIVPVLVRWRYYRSDSLNVDAKVAFREAGPALVSGLVDALADPRLDIREIAAGLLRIPDSAPDWIAALRAVAPTLEARVVGDDAALAAWAATVLADVDPDATGLVDALRAGLADPDPALRGRCAGALARLGPAAADASEDLVRLVCAEGEGLGALAAVGTPSDRAVPVLLWKLVTGEREDVRRAAAFALARYGADARDAVPILAAEIHGMRSWRSIHGNRRFEARGVRWPVTALARFGPVAVPAIPDLVAALGYGGDAMPSFESPPLEAIRALEAIGPPAVPALESALTGYGTEIRDRAAIALARIDPERWPETDLSAGLLELVEGRDTAFADRIAGALESKDAALRRAAALALLRLRVHVDEALPVIAAALAADWRPWPPTDRFESLGPAAPRLVPALIRAVERDGKNAGMAARLLGEIGPAAAVPALTAAAERHEPGAARALGRIGPAARAALPVLRRAYRSRNDHYREAARVAIRRITRE